MKNFLTPLLLLLAFFWFVYQERQKPFYFEEIDNTFLLQNSKKEGKSFAIVGYDKPLKSIDLENDNNISLFTQADRNYPNIYGFGDRFLVDLNLEVVVLDERSIIDALVDKGVMETNRIGVTKDSAYIFLEDNLYTYDKKHFKPIPYHFDFVADFFVDNKKLYIREIAKNRDYLLVLDRNLKNYRFYKIKKRVEYHIEPIFAKDSFFYYTDKRDKLEAISLDNAHRVIVKQGYMAKFRDYYIVKEKESFKLYRFPKELITAFRSDRDFSYFFVLKDHLYLLDNHKVVVKVDLTSGATTYIEPVDFFPLYYGTNDNYVAYYKKDTLYILDANLKLVKKYKVNLLPYPFEFDIDGKNIVANYHGEIRFNNKKIFMEKSLVTDLALDGEKITIVGFDRYKQELTIDLFKKDKHTQSYRLKVDTNEFIQKVVYYKNSIIISFASSTVLIKNGKIIKQIKYGKYGYLKRIKDKAYLSYDDNLIAINMNSFEIIPLMQNYYGARWGKNVAIYHDDIFYLYYIVAFKDKKIKFYDVSSVYEHYALKDYALFRLKKEKDSIFVLAKDQAYKLRLASKYNKILAIKPLEGNRFALLDKNGFRIIDIDKELNNANH